MPISVDDVERLGSGSHHGADGFDICAGCGLVIR